MAARSIVFYCILPLLYGIFALFPATLLFNDTGVFILFGILMSLVILLIDLKYIAYLFLVTIVITDHYFPTIGIGQTLRERNVLLLLVLAHFFLFIIVNNKLEIIRNVPREVIYFLVIVAMATIYGILNNNYYEWIKQDFVWSLFILSYFPFAFIFKYNKNVITALTLLCIFTTLMAILSIVTYFRTYERVISNAEVFFPIVILLSITMLSISKLSVIKKVTIVIMMIINIFAVIVSFTRSMWIATFCGIIILTAYLLSSGVTRIKKEILLKTIMIISVSLISLVIMTLLMPALWKMMQTRFAMIFVGGKDWSVLYRIIEYKKTIEAVLKSPLFGGGLGAVIYTPLNITTQTRLCYGTPYIHNSLMYWTLKYGILGVGLGTFFWMKLLIKMYDLMKKENTHTNKAVMVGLLTSLPMLLIYSLSSPHISVNTGQFYIGFILAVFFPIEYQNG